MEMCMKNLSILPPIHDSKNTNFLKFEWNLFSICSSDNVCESAIYIVPMFAQEGKAKDKDRKEDPKVNGKALLIGNNEMIVKKIDYKALQKRIAEL